MKKSLLIIIGLIIVVAIVVGVVLTQRPTRKEPEVYKIGAILPLTGKGASYGERAQRGLNLAFEDIKKKMPELRLKLLYEDSKFPEIKEAISAYHKLRSSYNIPVVITLSSDVSLAISPLANQDKVLQMAIVASTPAYTSSGDFTFRTTTRAEQEDKELAKAITSHYKKIALIYNNNERGLGHRNVLKREIERLDGEIVIEEAISPKGLDFRSHLMKIKERNPEAICIVAEPRNIGLILKQAEELGIKSQFFGTRSVEHKDVISIAGKSAEGIIYTFSFDPKSDNPLVRDVVERYREKYGEIPDYVAAEAYDALMLIANALNKCGKDTECMKEYLFGIKYTGLLGSLTFDENGDVFYSYRLKTIRNGQFVPYKK